MSAKLPEWQVTFTPSPDQTTVYKDQVNGRWICPFTGWYDVEGIRVFLKAGEFIDLPNGNGKWSVQLLTKTENP
jgi:hypothetical protein